MTKNDKYKQNNLLYNNEFKNAIDKLKKVCYNLPNTLTYFGGGIMSWFGRGEKEISAEEKRLIDERRVLAGRIMALRGQNQGEIDDLQRKIDHIDTVLRADYNRVVESETVPSKYSDTKEKGRGRKDEPVDLNLRNGIKAGIKTLGLVAVGTVIPSAYNGYKNLKNIDNTTTQEDGRVNDTRTRFSIELEDITYIGLVKMETVEARTGQFEYYNHTVGAKYANSDSNFVKWANELATFIDIKFIAPVKTHLGLEYSEFVDSATFRKNFIIADTAAKILKVKRGPVKPLHVDLIKDEALDELDKQGCFKNHGVLTEVKVGFVLKEIGKAEKAAHDEVINRFTNCNPFSVEGVALKNATEITEEKLSFLAAPYRNFVCPNGISCKDFKIAFEEMTPEEMAQYVAEAKAVRDAREAQSLAAKAHS